MIKNILITGGAGYIGSHISETFIDAMDQNIFLTLCNLGSEGSKSHKVLKAPVRPFNYGLYYNRFFQITSCNSKIPCNTANNLN